MKASPRPGWSGHDEGEAMQPSGVELMLTGFGIVGSLGGLIVLVYNAVNKSIQNKFNETMKLIGTVSTKLDQVDRHVQAINGRVGKLEVSFEDHKEADRDIHDRERRENERRGIEAMKDLEELKKEVVKLRDDPRYGQGCL